MDFFYHESGIRLPKRVALLPVYGSILMPHAHLNVPAHEEYLLKIASQVDEEDLFVGVVQPILDKHSETQRVPIFLAGTLGRITEVSESFDGSVSISIEGVCRFDIEE